MDNHFVKYSESNWIDIISKELGPDGDINSLYPPKMEGIQINPFAHTPTADFDPIITNPDPWKITAEINSKDAEETNKLALFFLKNGAQALKITLYEGQQLELIFKNVILEYIFVLLDLSQIKDQESIKQEIKEKHPSFKGYFLYSKHRPDASNHEEKKPVTTLRDALANQVDDSVITDSTIVTMEIGKHFILEIAKLRALRILWANLLKSRDLSLEKSLIIVALPAENSLVDDSDLSLIQLTYMAMSAIIGGADFIITNTHAMSAKGHQRTALHIQNILSMESDMGKVNDPAAGSYVIEDLTNKLAKHTWKAFKEVAGV